MIFTRCHFLHNDNNQALFDLEQGLALLYRYEIRHEKIMV